MTLLMMVIDVVYLGIYIYRLLVQIILFLYLILLIGLPSIVYHMAYYNLRYLSLDDIAYNILYYSDRNIHTRSSTNEEDTSTVSIPKAVKYLPRELREFFKDHL